MSNIGSFRSFSFLIGLVELRIGPMIGLTKLRIRPLPGLVFFWFGSGVDVLFSYRRFFLEKLLFKNSNGGPLLKMNINTIHDNFSE